MKLLIDRGVPVQMRDGVLLRCSIYRLNTRERMPVLIQRTPYNKAASASVNVPLDGLSAALAGYCVIVQDIRGRYSSAGNFAPFEQGLNDRYDTVKWAASEAWSNGQVGMFGTSYSGATQWLATGSDAPVQAIRPSPALRLRSIQGEARIVLDPRPHPPLLGPVQGGKRCREIYLERTDRHRTGYRER